MGVTPIVSLPDGLELLLGLVLVVATLVDVFVSILMPGVTVGSASIASLAQTVSVPVWRHAVRRGRSGGRARLANVFAPMLLAFAFSAWLLLLIVGFGLMFHACSGLFEPRLDALDQAVYVAGSSVLTLGVSEVDAHGLARWLILLAALSGFSIITASVTFILQVQSALQQREQLVLTLAGLAGRPASSIGLLEAFATLGMRDDLAAFFKDWRDWSALVLHTHVAHPVLCYFHSVDAEGDWVTALATVLDAATILVALTDDRACGTATLMHRAGARTAARLAGLLKLRIEGTRHPDASEVDALCERLARAGYAVRPGSQGVERLSRLREDFGGRLQALADHLGAERTAIPTSRAQP